MVFCAVGFFLYKCHRGGVFFLGLLFCSGCPIGGINFWFLRERASRRQHPAKGSFLLSVLLRFSGRGVICLMGVVVTCVVGMRVMVTLAFGDRWVFYSFFFLQYRWRFGILFLSLKCSLFDMRHANVWTSVRITHDPRA